MPTPSKNLLDWLKYNAIQIMILIGVCFNFYLFSIFATKNELQTHIKVEESAAVAVADQKALRDAAITANLTQLTLTISKLEYNNSSITENQKQIQLNAEKTQLNTEKLIQIETRLNNFEKNAENEKNRIAH